jgi:hypothetical protein
MPVARYNVVFKPAHMEEPLNDCCPGTAFREGLIVTSYNPWFEPTLPEM